MKQPIILFFAIACCVACSTPKNYTYFKDVPDSIKNYIVADTGYSVLTIKSDDVLQINISSPNPEASSFFLTQGTNTINPTGATPTAPTSLNTYLVDKEGGIDVPLIGRVMVKGLTTGDVKNSIKSKVSTFLKDPIV